MKSVVIACLLVLCVVGAFAHNHEHEHRTPHFRPVPSVHHFVYEIAEHQVGSYTPQWSDCGNADSAWVTTSVTFQDKPAKGKTLSGTTCGTVRQTSTFAQDAITVKLNGKNQITQTLNLGNKQVETGGTFCYSSSSKIPGLAPSGNYQITSVLKDPSGNVLGCTNVYFIL